LQPGDLLLLLFQFGLPGSKRGRKFAGGLLPIRTAFCTWIIATLVGAAWAFARAANPRTSAGKTTRFFFKLKTPK
jgi:hypothetical protein